jgi:hypothetical protein
MHACNPTSAPIVKGNKYGSFQSLRNQYEIDQIKSVPYASAIGSLIYAQVCTHSDLTFVTEMLDRYQKNPGVSHWNGIKKTLRYIQSIKSLMLTYERSDNLAIQNQILWVVWILIDQRQVMYSNSKVGLYHGVAPSRLS